MRKNLFKKSAAILLWITAMALSGFAAELALSKTGAPPKIDGVLDDPCWKSAAIIDTLNVIGEPGKTAKDHKIYVTFDDQWLYVAYDIHQPEADRQPPKYFAHDDYIQRDDCVKLSFDPGTNGEVYYHFKVNRANARRELRVSLARGQEIESWNIPWRSAAKDNPTGWTSEIAVPLALLPPIDKLDKAKINLLATRNVVTIADKAVNLAEVKVEALSAAPLTKDWDEPERFLPVKGMENLKVKAPFLPYAENVKTSGYQEKNGKYYYDVLFTVKPLTASPGTIIAEWQDIPENGKASAGTRTVPVVGKAFPVTLAVPVEALGKRTGTLRVRDVATGEELQSEQLADTAMEALNNLFSAYLDRSYYTDEANAKVICSIGLPESSLKDIKLIAKNAQGEIIAESGDRDSSWDWLWSWLGDSKASDKTRLDIPLASLKTGTLDIEIQLVRVDGSALFSRTLQLVKRALNPGNEWKIDRENRVTLRNGKPFFVHGVNTPVRNTNLEASMRDIQELGFNAILYENSYSKWTPPGASGLEPDSVHYLDLAKKYDLLVMPWMEGYAAPAPKGAGYVDVSGGQNLVNLHFDLIREPKFAKMTRAEKSKFWADAVLRQTPRFLAAAERVKNHPNFLGYFIMDEPVDMKHYDSTGPARELYQKLHETDGYHPVMANFCYLPEGDEYVNWSDILAVDPYWVQPGRPDRVSTFTDQARRRAEERRNPNWTIPAAEVWSFTDKRAVAPREQLCQTYLALIHGATGLWYFTYDFKYQFTADAFKQINEQLKVLGPMVVAPAVKQVLTGGNRFADIQSALFRNPEGGFVLLAANRCPYPVDATFTLANLGDAEIRQLFRDWRATAKNASFADQFEPFGVRAYCFADNGKMTGPVEIGVTPKARPEAVTPEPVIPATGRSGKRNLVRNPGFEEATLPGAPDYYPLSGSRGSGPRFGRPGAFLAMDDASPFEGKYSLKLRCVRPETWRNYLHFKLAPKVDKPTPFVFSAYLRADRDGVTARFLRNGASFGDGKPITLTKEWKRYYAVGEIAPGTAATWMNSFQINFDAPTDANECSVWIDALQIEQGTAPTAYEP